MAELPLGTLRTERKERSTPIRPPRPAFNDRPPLVSLLVTLGAKHQSNVGALTAGRRARHSYRLRLRSLPGESLRVVSGGLTTFRRESARSGTLRPWLAVVDFRCVVQRNNARVVNLESSRASRTDTGLSPAFLVALSA